MGSTHSQSTLYRFLQNDKKTRLFLAAGNHAKAYADVLYRSHLVYKNPQNDELIIRAEKANVPPKELDLFD